MSVRVLFFGPLADIAGSGPHLREFPAGTRVQELLERCFDDWPPLREWEGALLVAVNRSYARRDEVIPPDSEVAVMPPVQGG